MVVALCLGDKRLNYDRRTQGQKQMFCYRRNTWLPQLEKERENCEVVSFYAHKVQEVNIN